MNNLTEQKKRWIRRGEKEKEFCTLLFSGDMSKGNILLKLEKTRILHINDRYQGKRKVTVYE